MNGVVARSDNSIETTENYLRSIITARLSVMSSGRIQCVILSAAYPLKIFTNSVAMFSYRMFNKISYLMLVEQPLSMGKQTTGLDTRIGLKENLHPNERALLLKNETLNKA